MFEQGIPEHLNKIIHRAARRIMVSSRGLVELDDLVAEVYLWMVKHPAKMEGFLDPKDRGACRVFDKIAYRRMQDYVLRERTAKTGGKASDQYFYHVGMVEELLPDVWNVNDRLFATVDDRATGMKRGRTIPSEGNSRAAMLADVQAAVNRLPEHEQELLRMRFYDGNGGMTLRELAAMLDISEAQASRRMSRLVDKVVDHLGGESPSWNE